MNSQKTVVEDFGTTLCSAAYAKAASQLSSKIEQVDTLLSNMEGKIEASVADGDLILSFTRVSDKLWGLVIGKTKEDSRNVTQVSVVTKIAAAMMLPGLLDLIQSKTQEQVKQVEKAIEAIDSVLCKVKGE